GWDSLVKHLTGRNYSTDVLVKSGLALERTRGDGYNDRFRNRLMIPIADRQGRVIAFGGRALSKEDNPKYLNTAETAIFSKSRTLYGLHLASKTMADKGRAIVTEGYFDTIACHLAGFTEAVATLGTALGEEHVQMLRRHVGASGRIYLVYDGDSAGVNAALRGQALFRAAGVDVRIALLPPQHDPDTLLREGGPAALEQYLANALSPTAFELERLLKTQPAADIEGRARLFHAAAEVLLPLPALERMEYSAWLVERVIRAGALGDMSLLQQELLNETKALERNPRPAAPVPPPAELPPSAPLTPQREVPLEREVMTLMVQQPDFAALVIGQFTAEVFTHPYYRAVFQQFATMAAAGQPLEVSHIRSEDEAVTTTISCLAVRETIPLDNLSPQSMLDRLRDAYETRRHAPPDLNDPEALRAFTARLREKSKRVAKRIIGEE
ncbi:MAG: toprim domain-containing protein, partial [bacterium]